MRAILASCVALVLVACNQMATTPIAKPNVPEPMSGATGPGCASQITRFKDILAYDLSVGRVHKSVYENASGPLAQAESTCAAGRSGEAMAILTRTKRASGYG